jgi:hypothetical protein
MNAAEGPRWEWKPGLRTETSIRAYAGTIGLKPALIEHEAQQLMILQHNQWPANPRLFKLPTISSRMVRFHN